ncbi:tetratricopeptide repeat protein [Pseudoalteromonas sp. SWN166]|uniref:tetratricopeptide repeat protein n=1 Tax=Pseudoalteromonas sp. SWN166 TaxID=2792061 RepID=UPI0018CE7536|nr:tetratricopeptide repeat protein [Pseudoalteromonas sp. SWN166]MBH0039756.1 tetratricopeptide repeat protein [Pseudoalteromonas sp. SWN166]
MSVINNMLKNIEQREAKQVNVQEGINVKPIYDLRNIAFKVVIVLIMLSVIFLAYLYLPNADKQETQPKSVLPPQKMVAVITSNLSDSEDGENTVEPSVGQDAVKKVVQVEPVNQVDNDLVEPKLDEATLLASQPIEDPIVIAQVKQSPELDNDNELAASELTVSKPKITPVAKAKPQNTMTKSAPEAKSPQDLLIEQLAAAKQAIQFGLYNEAISDLNTILAQSPLHVEARNLLAATYFKQQDINSAQQVLQAGIRQSPNVLEWRVMLSKILIMQQEYEGVLLLLTDEFESQANLDFWVLQGTAAQSASKHHKALESFKHLTQLQPSQAKWWLALATSKDALGEYLDAKQLYKVALDLGGLNTAMTQHALQRLVALKEAV